MQIVRRSCWRLLAVLLWLPVQCQARKPGSDVQTTRIVSLVPGLTEILFKIGAGDQVVGVSPYCLFPPEAQSRPQVGGLLNPSLEGVLRLEPDRVLLYRSQADFASKLKGLGIVAHLQELDRLQHVHSAIERLGAFTGCTTESILLQKSMLRSFTEIQERNAKRIRVRALVVVSRDPAGLRHLYQAGPGNFLGELLVLAGGEHAVEGSAAISREQIIRGDPEVIIDMSQAEQGPRAGLEHSIRNAWKELSTVKAVRSGRIHVMTDPHALVPGPHLPVVAREFEKLLHQ